VNSAVNFMRALVNSAVVNLMQPKKKLAAVETEWNEKQSLLALQLLFVQYLHHFAYARYLPGNGQVLVRYLPGTCQALARYVPGTSRAM
jgi:hypothetical protein